jgi:hypothetical protein
MGNDIGKIRRGLKPGFINSKRQQGFVQSRSHWQRILAEKKQSARKEVAKEVVEAPTEVGTWDSDAEDDEHGDEPDVGDEGDVDGTLEGTDEEWGGPGRQQCEEKKFDPFFATRRFAGDMRSRIQNAMKPGGWL